MLFLRRRLKKAAKLKVKEAEKAVLHQLLRDGKTAGRPHLSGGRGRRVTALKR